ncbi:MAG: type II toxin-antitoxin system RelE/ParE family toxin [Verrucomicrobiota bacterium]
MKLRLIMDGTRFTVFEMGDSDELGKFMQDLDQHRGKESLRLARRIDQLANLGASRKHDEFNVIGEGLFEAKTRYGARVAFFYDAGHLVICANTYLKQTDRAPKNFIATARARKRQYEQAKARREEVEIILDDNQVMPRRLPTWSR